MVDVLRALVWAGTATAVGSLALTVDNLRRIRTPDPGASPGPEPLAVLLPVRDEADDVVECVQAIRDAADRWPGAVRIIVLDDESTDGTAALVAGIAACDDRVTLLHGGPTPAGWLGKTWACHQLAEHAAQWRATTDADDGILCFVDADVRVQPHAFTSSVALMRDAHLDLLCPYPRQQVSGPAERLVQPLLQWSWMSTLPLGPAERSPRPSLSAANGQLLFVDADVYIRSGGHRAVRDQVLEDIALLRQVKTSGGSGVVADGSDVATCRMYDGWQQVRDGYRKSLWSAFGSPGGAVAVSALLLLGYVAPLMAAVIARSPVGALGYLAGVASRVLVARRTRGRIWPDCLAHPVSIALFACLTADSVISRRRGVLAWKGRPIEVGR